MTITYRMLIDNVGRPRVPPIDCPSLSDAKRTFEEMLQKKPVTGLRATITEYDGDRAIRTVCIGHPRVGEPGGVLWEKALGQ